MVCINKCFVDYDNPLTGIEKACLARCQDRASDFYVVAQSDLSPFIKSNQRGHLHHIDGVIFKDQ